MKKSKFCAHAWPCSSSEEAMHLIGGQSDASASHNCWAYKVVERPASAASSMCLDRIACLFVPCADHTFCVFVCMCQQVGQEYRSSDDGEPGGTAGRPILSAIEGEGLDGVAVLVIRQALKQPGSQAYSQLHPWEATFHHARPMHHTLSVSSNRNTALTALQVLRRHQARRRRTSACLWWCSKGLPAVGAHSA